MITDGSISADGTQGSTASAGTIYLKASSEAAPVLILDNNGKAGATTPLPAGSGPSPFRYERPEVPWETEADAVWD